MAKEKKAAVAEEEDVKELDDNAFKNNQKVDDEASLSAALAANPFKMFFVRTAIKLKNHTSVIPLLLTVISMMIITFTIHIHVNALIKLRNDEMNAFWFFVNCLLSLILCLAYMQVSSKKSSKKKKIIFFALFIAVLACEIVLDFNYIHDINVETNLFNSFNRVTDDEEYHYIANSLKWTTVHITFLFITGGLAIINPFLQPLISKIHLRIK